MVERSEEFEKCQAAIHHSKCDGYADNIDHFTPKCILKRARVHPKDRDENNLVPMNRYCHVLKDESTPDRRDLLDRQLKGEMIDLSEYKRAVRDKHYVIFVPAFNGD